jgi:hypothetical protein
MTSRMAEPTGIVEDHAKMVESSGMPSRMAKVIGIHEAVEMNEAIVTTGAYCVIGAIGLADAPRMLVGMSIPSTKNN